MRHRSRVQGRPGLPAGAGCAWARTCGGVRAEQAGPRRQQKPPSFQPAPLLIACSAQGCSFNDQVCQYRCIVSHETKEFGDFGLCILQKHNCRGLDAQPPAMPGACTTPGGGVSCQRAATSEAVKRVRGAWLPPTPAVAPWPRARPAHPALPHLLQTPSPWRHSRASR